LETKRQTLPDKRKKALQWKEGMQVIIIQRRQTEIEKQGLVIIRAYYGHLRTMKDYPDTMTIVPCEIVTDPLECSEEIIDVTDQLQYQVENSEIHLGAFSKFLLPGFYDPCTGHPNYLEVYFSLSGLPYRTIIDEKAPLHIPFIKNMSEE